MRLVGRERTGSATAISAGVTSAVGEAGSGVIGVTAAGGGTGSASSIRWRLIAFSRARELIIIPS
jgi:hypothetical protein